MSNLFTAPWTVSERITLLTNIIQGDGHDVPLYLLQTIIDRDINPKWNDIALPKGRSVHACQIAYDEMRSYLQRGRSFSSGTAYAPLATPYPQPRSVSEQEMLQPTQRRLEPRPARSTDSPLPSATNGEAFTILRPFAPELNVERRRKRGRPTKEEAEERDRRLAAAGQTYEPKKRPAKKPRPSELPSALSEGPLSTSPLLQTPSMQTVDPKEETSSDRRRSRRLREEEESSQQAPLRSPLDDSGNERVSDSAQSPSDRLLARSGERAQGVASVARDIQQSISPILGQEPDRAP